MTSAYIFQQHFTAFLYASSDHIDLWQWLSSAADGSAEKPAVLAGRKYYSRTGTQIELLVEAIGPSLFIHRYRQGADHKHHCELNSRSEGLLDGQQTIWSCERKLEIQHYTERTCQLHHRLTFALFEGPMPVSSATLSQLSLAADDHFRQETIKLAECLERSARNASG